MAWTKLPDVVVGELITAAKWNECIASAAMIASVEAAADRTEQEADRAEVASERVRRGISLNGQI